jgi:SAM-dependent methyltransferase
MSNKKSLDELANYYNTDKGTAYQEVSRHGYAPIYDEYLNKWRQLPIRMLEIGVCMEGTEGGHSINMWNDYFEKANIYAFDIIDMSKSPSVTENDRVSFFKGDQNKREDFEEMYKTFNNKEFDFILEDGSHQHEHQMISLGHLFKYVKSGGYYILEDITQQGRKVCCIRNDETYDALIEFQTIGEINNNYLLPEEKQYLKDNIKNIEFHLDVQNAYYTAVITKK